MTLLAHVPPDETPAHPYTAPPPSAFPALVAAEVARARTMLAPVADLPRGAAATFAAAARAPDSARLALLARLVRVAALAQRVAEDALPAADPAPPATVAGIWEPKRSGADG